MTVQDLINDLQKYPNPEHEIVLVNLDWEDMCTAVGLTNRTESETLAPNVCYIHPTI